MKVEEIKTSLLKMNPENRRHFRDISEKNPEFWDQFVENIKEQGILEPLQVDKKTMKIIMGHQRWMAAKVLGMETVPCLLTDSADGVSEEHLLSSNIFRRQLDGLEVMKAISSYRKLYNERRDVGLMTRPSKEELGSLLGVNTHLVTAANVWEALPKELQEELEEWFREHDPTNQDLIKKVDELHLESLTAAKSVKDLTKEVEGREKLIAELQRKLGKVTTAEQVTKFKDKIKKISLERRTLAKALAAEKAKDRTFQEVMRAEKLIIQIQKGATSLATDLGSFMKILKENDSVGGLDMAIAQDRLRELLSAVKAFVDRWQKRATEVRRIK